MKNERTALRILCWIAFPSLLLGGCATAILNRNPVGERFPEVRGTSLAGVETAIPKAYEGKPVLLLIGYVQNAQFDIDRWALGLAQAGTPVRAVEIPTIKGLAPRMIASGIDEGMRKGIPKEDWVSVVTVYRDAGRIVSMLGNTNPNNARVLLLDARGVVIWAHDRGYSAAKVMELDGLVRKER